MKRLLLLAALLVGLLKMDAVAQQDLRFGFQLSPTFGWMRTDNSQINSNGTNLGLKLGMTGEFYFRENYAFTSGIGFFFNSGGELFYEENLDSIRMWSEVDIPGAPTTYEGGTGFKYSIQQVEIPLGLKLRTREFGYIRYFMEPQLTLGFRTQSRGQVKNTALDEAEKYDIKSAVNLLNLSWGLGAGIEYSVSTGTALVGGIGFQSGFADMTKDKNAGFQRDGVRRDDKSKGRLNGLIIKLGVMF